MVHTRAAAVEAPLALRPGLRSALGRRRDAQLANGPQVFRRPLSGPVCGRDVAVLVLAPVPADVPGRLLVRVYIILRTGGGRLPGPSPAGREKCDESASAPSRLQPRGRPGVRPAASRLGPGMNDTEFRRIAADSQARTANYARMVVAGGVLALLLRSNSWRGGRRSVRDVRRS